MSELPPGIILILGAFLVPFLRGNFRSAYMLALPLIGIWSLLTISEGSHFAVSLFGYNLSPIHQEVSSKFKVFQYSNSPFNYL